MLIIARRGASGYAPENTLEAFGKATQIDCDVVELDIHKTKDGHIVVMHDHTVKRTTDGLGKIDDLTLKELKNFHEKNGESIPTLQGVIDLLKNKRKLMLDIKDRAAEPEILKIVDENDVAADVVIDSDFPEVIENIKRLNPRVHVYLGGVKNDNALSVIKHAKLIGAEMIKVRNTLVTPSVVKVAHQHGIGVYVWGAEKDFEISQMLELGVDAIVCNFPDKVARLAKDY